MDYRMISIVADADENVVDLINKKLNEQGYKRAATTLKFVGFEAKTGTEFYLNNQPDAFKVPSTGYFISPYTGERYMKITSLKFPEGFSGDIYYIN